MMINFLINNITVLRGVQSILKDSYRMCVLEIRDALNDPIVVSKRWQSQSM